VTFRRLPRHPFLLALAQAAERLILGNPDQLRARLPRLAVELERVDRFARRDFRRNISRTLGAQLSRADLDSGRVGSRVPRFRDGRGVVRDFAGLPRRIAASWSLHSERTETRTLTTLRRCGLVGGPGEGGASIKQPRERTPTGAWRAFAAIRRVDLDALAAACGLGQWLGMVRADRADRRKRGADAIRTTTAAAASAARLAFTAAIAQLARGATFAPDTG
jgi:hypothetical protein